VKDPNEYYSSLTKVPAEVRIQWHIELKDYYGSIAEISRRCRPPKNRATITLWLQGRVQSAVLDEQVPQLIREYFKERASGP
jgi:hypothetical protein